MAEVDNDKVVKTETTTTLFSMSMGALIRIVLLGAAIGFFTWLLGLAIDKYLLTPFFCQGGDNVAICANSTVVASNIAAVLVGIMAVPLLSSIYARRAILVVIAAVVALWGVSAWIAGEWFVSLIWTILATAVVYAALSWINRLRSTIIVVILMVLFVIAARLVLSFT